MSNVASTAAAPGGLVQNVTLIATALVAALIGIWKYIKTEGTGVKDKPAETGTVVAASFIDSRLLKELIDALREHMEEYARENKKNMRAMQDVREATQECTEAVNSQTDATLNMLRFVKGRGTKSGV